jgi:hypothetical protein
MNQRIRLLAIQAGATVDKGTHPLTGVVDGLFMGPNEVEKFAELIVRECINEIAYIGKANEVFGDRTDRGGLNHILWTTETAIEKIKEHFGVEE